MLCFVLFFLLFFIFLWALNWLEKLTHKILDHGQKHVRIFNQVMAQTEIIQINMRALYEIAASLDLYHRKVNNIWDWIIWEGGSEHKFPFLLVDLKILISRPKMPDSVQTQSGLSLISKLSFFTSDWIQTGSDFQKFEKIIQINLWALHEITASLDSYYRKVRK